MGRQGEESHMTKKLWFLLFVVCFMFLPLSVYAGGGKELSLTIENKTGENIFSIKISKTGSGSPITIKQEISPSSNTIIQLEKKISYDIILVGRNEREYLKKGQSWKEDATITFSRADMVDVFITIENKTGARISEIIVSELGRKNTVIETISYPRNIENNASTTIKLKRQTLYGILLIDANERQYAHKRNSWEDDERLVFNLGNIQDRNIWDKFKRIMLWPAY